MRSNNLRILPFVLNALEKRHIKSIKVPFILFLITGLFFLGNTNVQGQCDVVINISETSGDNVDDGFICSGALVTLTGSGSGASSFTYSWSHGLTGTAINTVTGIQDQVMLKPTSSQTYSVTVTSSNPSCSSVASIPVNITNAATAPTLSSVTVCPGNSGTLSVMVGGSSPPATYTYLWGDGSTASSLIATAGTYMVTVSEPGGCSTALTASINESPSPVLASNYDICTSGGSVTLDPFVGVPAGTTANYTFAWTLPNGTTASTSTLAASMQGTYTVTITDNNGTSNDPSDDCTATVSTTVTITTNPTTTISPAVSTICSSSSTSSSVLTSPAISGATYVWTLPGGSQVNTGSVNSYTATAIGSYSVSVTSGSCTAIGTAEIKPEITPILSPNGTVNICTGDPVTFTAGGGAANASYTLYQVSVGGTPTIVGGAPITPTSIPTWTVSSIADGDNFYVTINNPSGCSATSASTTVMVNAFNPVLIASLSSICTGDPVTYFAAGASGSTYEFFINGISQGVQPANSNSFTPSVVINDGDLITVNIVQPNGCSGMANSVTMTVNNSFTATLSSTATNNAICINESVTFTASGGGTGALYEFFKTNNGVLTNLQVSSTTNTYTTPSLSDLDTVYVSVTSNGAGSCSVISPQIVTTVRDVIPTLTATTGATTFCQGDIVTFIAGGGVTYEYFVNNVSQGGASGVNSFTTNTLPIGTSTVEVRVGSATGCMDSKQLTVSVTPAPTITLSPLNVNVCEGTPVTFNATSNVAGPTFQFFINGALQTSTGATFTTTALTSGDIVSVSGSSSGTCSKLVSATPAIITGATSAGTISGTNSLCLGSTVQLTNNSTITTGTWLSSDNTIAMVSSTGVVTAVAAGSVDITYTVTTGSCSSTTPEFPVFVSTSGSLTIGSSVIGNTICPGDNVTLSASAGGTYNWTASTGGTLPTTSTITVSPTTTTTYTLNSTGGSCSGTSSIQIIVNAEPVAGAITGGTVGGTNICEGAAITLSPAISGVGTVVWSSSNPAIASINATTGVVTASNVLTTLPATAVISYTVTQNGCTATSPAYQVTVIDCTGTPSISVCVEAKALLEGPFDASTQLMNDALRSLPMATNTTLPSNTVSNSPFPLTEPYSALPNFTHIGGGGVETTSAAVLGVSGSNAIVDWVFLELRDATSPSTVLATKSALIQRDGDIVDASDGTSPVCITAGNNNYYLAVRHRNHLGIMTDNPIALATGVSATVDMTTTTSGTPGYSAVDGTHPVDTIGNRVVMRGGDANSDGKTIFTGPTNDRDAVFFDIFLDPANSTASYNHIRPGYYNGDTNLDGEVKYQGPTNDLDRLMFFNVLFYPSSIGVTQIINQQLP